MCFTIKIVKTVAYLKDSQSIECQCLETWHINKPLYQKNSQRIFHKQIDVCVKVMWHWSTDEQAAKILVYQNLFKFFKFTLFILLGVYNYLPKQSERNDIVFINPFSARHFLGQYVCKRGKEATGNNRHFTFNST